MGDRLKKFRSSALLLTVLGGFITAIVAILMILDLAAGRAIPFAAMSEMGMGLIMLTAGGMGVLSYKESKSIMLCLIIGIIALLATASNVAFSLAVNLSSPFGWFILAYPLVTMLYIIEAHKLIKSDLPK